MTFFIVSFRRQCYTDWLNYWLIYSLHTNLTWHTKVFSCRQTSVLLPVVCRCQGDWNKVKLHLTSYLKNFWHDIFWDYVRKELRRLTSPSRKEFTNRRTKRINMFYSCYVLCRPPLSLQRVSNFVYCWNTTFCIFYERPLPSRRHCVKVTIRMMSTFWLKWSFLFVPLSERYPIFTIGNWIGVFAITFLSFLLTFFTYFPSITYRPNTYQ